MTHRAKSRVENDEDDEGYEKEETSMMKGFYGVDVLTSISFS
jgi:hypothetical protein